ESDRRSERQDAVRRQEEQTGNSVGCELWDLSLAGPPGRRLLRVYIDAPGGVDLERCVRVSRTLRPVLDDTSVGLGDVDLEVSSPGAERPPRGMKNYPRPLGE